jgi:L-threonylcarbamoyladenylate synthase
MMFRSIPEALDIIEQGGLIAYPTEAVFGLGCDPFNEKAVKRLLQLKTRSMSKGLILLINSYDQLWPLVDLTENHPLVKTLKQTWPGPLTYLLPKSEALPLFISGEHPTVAIRMSAHLISHALCERGPICSTSANLSGTAPLKTAKSVMEQFGDTIDGVVSGELGGEDKPTSIVDLLTGLKRR